MNRMTANAFLNRFSPMGCTASPLFLKRITARAQTTAVSSAIASPKYVSKPLM